MAKRTRQADADRKSPVKVFRIGYVSASVFAREISGDFGSRTLHSVTLQKRYTDGDEVKFTSSFDLAELPQATRVLQLAAHFVEQQEAEIQLGDRNDG